MPPALVVFDVNETLSDLGPLEAEFAAVGLGGQAGAWFAGVLRDGFALTAVGSNPSFRELAAESLRLRLARSGAPDVDAGVDRVLGAFATLPVHADVVAGVQALRRAGVTLVTLSNGATSIADQLLTRAGIRDEFDRLLSVEDARLWKPAAAAYTHALEQCGVRTADAMLVAVHPWDIEGAGRAGLRTGWLNRDAGPYPAYFRAPDVEAADLVELAALVAGRES